MIEWDERKISICLPTRRTDAPERGVSIPSGLQLGSAKKALCFSGIEIFARVVDRRSEVIRIREGRLWSGQRR